MSIAIVTDTACNFTPESAEKNGIHLLPIEITFGDKTYKDAFDITTQEFYELMESSDIIPSTAQPKPIDVYQLYEKLSHDYDEILSINLVQIFPVQIKRSNFVEKKFIK